MSEWQKVKIGDLFNIEKGSLQSSKCTNGDFDFITASCDWKKHNEYTHETEALIVAVAASGSLGRVHYVNGKFISSDLCFILTPKNHDKYPLNFEFYFHILRSIREDLVKSTATGTSKLAINKGNFSNYKLPYFDIEHQKRFCKKLINLESNKKKLNQNSKFQQSLLIFLRQQILQDAISGKLTADWRAENPDTEPASKLLEQIKAEKEKLIAEKKIKKEKPLPKIAEDEVPFELPEGWEWCRLEQIIYESPRNGYSPKTVEFQTNVKTLKLGATTQGYFIPDEIKYVNENIDKESFLWLKNGDILIQRGNARELVGISAVFNRESQEFIYPDLMMKIKPVDPISSVFLHKFLLSPLVRAYFRNNATGSQKTMPKINQSVVSNTLIPLPPRAEQRAIVAKVERLMEYASQLEEKIAQNANNAETLMQAFLGEVFRK